MPINILDLFAGAGGLSLGFEMVKDDASEKVFELYRAVEYDKYACETLRIRHGKEKVIEGDLTKKKTIQKIIKECRGKVSIVIGGIPCQSFSYLGPRSGYGVNTEKFRKDKRDNSYREFREIVTKIRPDILVIENVKGILTKRDGRGKKIIEKIIRDFEAMDYTFPGNNGQKYIILNAADFGVPQIRERVILIGIMKKWKKIDEISIEPTNYDPTSQDSEKLAEKGLKPYVTLAEALGDLPRVRPKITTTDLDDKEIRKVERINPKINNGKEEIPFDKERFEKHLNRITAAGKNYFSFVRPNGYPNINYHTARYQQLSDIRLFKSMKQGETAKEFCKREPRLAKNLIKYDMKTFKDKYRKQNWKEPCTTIFAHLEKDGNRFIHPKQARTITPREAARIQSFPDDFIIYGSLKHKFRQIGNAVPPLMAYNIAKSIYRIINE